MVTTRGRFMIRPRFIWLMLLLLCFLLFYSFHARKAEIAQQEEQLRSLSETYYEESIRTDNLRATYSQVGTDRYVEQQARQQFGYLMSDELRFVLAEPSAAETAAPQAQTGTEGVVLLEPGQESAPATANPL